MERRDRDNLDSQALSLTLRLLNHLPLIFAAVPSLAVGYFVAIPLKQEYYVAWVCALSLCTFLVYGWDKLAAVKTWRRTPEASLHALAFAGGWIGAIAGRSIFRHKTQKAIFTVLIIAAASMHAGAVWFFYFK